jgi:ferric-dicitrate binding protein FerR (iron transport regulator)
MDYAKFIPLLKKQSKNEKLSEQEQNAMKDWKNKHADGDDQLEKIWDLSARYDVGFKPNTEKGLKRLRQRIEEERATKQTPKTTLIKIRLWRWAAVAAIAIGCALGLRLILQPDLPVYQTASGEIKEVTLPDGSIVVLNEQSTLRLDRAFVRGKRRSVDLEGEAFFDVESDSGNPFTISTSETRIEVLGTEFNLRAYPMEDSTVVAVSEGKVRFADQKETLVLETNTRGACYHLTKVMEKKQETELQLPDWYRYRAQNFRGETVQHLFKEIENRYDVELTFSDEILSPACNSITFSIKKEESLVSLLKRLETIFNGEIKKTGKNTYRVLKILC